MFPAEQRLASSEAITDLYRTGKRASVDGVLLSSKVNGADKSRFAVVVSKKFSLSAVKRNAQKRNIVAAVEKFVPDMTTNADIVISYNKSERMLSYEESLEIIKKAFTKLNLL